MGEKLNVAESFLEAEFEWVYTVHAPNGGRRWRVDGQLDAEDKVQELQSLAIQAGLTGEYTITRRKRITALYIGEEEIV